MKFFLKSVAVLFLLVLLAGAAVGVWIYKEYMHLEEVRTSEETVYVLKKGTGLRAVYHDVYAEDVNPYIFRLWLRMHPELTGVKSGTYVLPAGSSLVDALGIMVSGRVRNYSIAIIEGGRLSDLLKLIASDKRLKHELAPNVTYKEIAAKLGIEQENPEGLFMPDTYSFEDGTSDIDLLKRAHHEYQEYMDKEYASRDSDLPYKEAYEALIMASIIEKESAVPNERPMVASVFINRLKVGMKLQTDPTVIYGVGDRYRGHVLRSFLTDKNPYNTYVIDGLPPTPIALPSRASIHAALHPAQTDYLFFVAAGPDSRQGHVFSKSVQDHEKAVRKYRKSVSDYKKSVSLKGSLEAQAATAQAKPEVKAKESIIDSVMEDTNVSGRNKKQAEDSMKTGGKDSSGVKTDSLLNASFGNGNKDSNSSTDKSLDTNRAVSNTAGKIDSSNDSGSVSKAENKTEKKEAVDNSKSLSKEQILAANTKSTELLDHTVDNKQQQELGQTYKQVQEPVQTRSSNQAQETVKLKDIVDKVTDSAHEANKISLKTTTDTNEVTNGGTVGLMKTEADIKDGADEKSAGVNVNAKASEKASSMSASKTKDLDATR